MPHLTTATQTTRRLRPPIAPSDRTLGIRSLDPAMEIALQLAIARETHALEVAVVASRRGKVLSSVGESNEAFALAALAASSLRDCEVGERRMLLSGRIYAELIELDSHICIVAAQSASLIEEAELIAESLLEIFPGRESPAESGTFCRSGGDDFDFGDVFG